MGSNDEVRIKLEYSKNFSIIVRFIYLFYFFNHSKKKKIGIFLKL